MKRKKWIAHVRHVDAEKSEYEFPFELAKRQNPELLFSKKGKHPKCHSSFRLAARQASHIATVLGDEYLVEFERAED